MSSDNNNDDSSNIKVPTHLNINELSALTGYERKSIGEKLTKAGIPNADGPRNSKIYSVQQALPIIYSKNTDSSVEGKLDKEKLKLQTAKRKLAELDLAEKEQKLIPIEDIVDIVEKEYTTVRNILTQLPSALATKLSVETDSRVISELIDAEVQGALSNLKLTSEEAIKADYTPVVSVPEEETNED